MPAPLVRRLSMDKLERLRSAGSSLVEAPLTQVVGTTNLYENGRMRLIPAPTPDPKDPLNLPHWRKIAAIIAVCFFGALALSAEVIIGALIPVFSLEYAGINPKILGDLNITLLNPPGVVELNPVKMLDGLGGPPLWKVTLLASLPLLTNGISSYFLIPLSISIGRRPVLLACGIMAWTGGFWAGVSRNLVSHIAARCFQALGAGAVEALIPLIIQDMMFIHQRNRAMSSIWAIQGLIIVSLGIASPVIVVSLGWRFVYFITSSLSVVAWLALCAFLPETRWVRTPEELNGSSVHYIYPGENRPRLDAGSYGKRTFKSNCGVFPNGFENRAAGRSMIDTVRTMVFPNILWATAVSSLFISIQGAAAQTGSAVLIAAGWQFRTLGLAVVPIVIGAPVVWLLGGFLADKISNVVARRNGGRREPETHLISLILPLLMGILGCVLFGYAAQNIKTTHWIVFLSGVFFISVGFLTTTTVLNVYVVESYPQWAGPVLVNVSSFRCIIGFVMSFRATTWVEQRGFLGSFSIYAAVLAVLGTMLPFMYVFGKRIRQWTSGTVRQGNVSKEDKKESYMEY